MYALSIPNAFCGVSVVHWNKGKQLQIPDLELNNRTAENSSSTSFSWKQSHVIQNATIWEAAVAEKIFGRFPEFTTFPSTGLVAQSVNDSL